MRVTAAQVRDQIRAPLRIVKADSSGPYPKRFVLGLAYPAARLDGHGEGMTAEELEATAWGYLQKQEIGLFHQDGTVGHARPVESYLWPAEPWTVTDVTGNQQTIRRGDWLLGAVWDPQAWSLVRAGKINGWSMDGLGHRRKVPKSQLVHVEKQLTTTARSLQDALRAVLREGNS